MKLSDIKDPKLRQRLLQSMAEAERLKHRLKYECPHPNENETYRPLPNPKPEPTVRHEPLAAGPGTPPRTRRTLVRIVSFRSVLLDPDNLCVKGLVDGLRYCRIIPDDREADIELSVSQRKCRKEEERTEVEVIYPF